MTLTLRAERVGRMIASNRPGRAARLLAAGATAALVSCAAPPAPPPPPPPPPAPAPQAPRPYVVLLPDADGRVGQVIVQSGTQGASQTLSRAHEASYLDRPGASFQLDDARLQRELGAALQAAPRAPEQFLLYFESGGIELTRDSRSLLATIVERARARGTVDLSVIGHTDTVGRPEANAALGLRRATAVAEMVRNLGLQTSGIAIESHGERNLLVPTADETAEPRNRRVEITVR